MSHFIKFYTVFALVFCLGFSSAKADVFYWEDSITGASLAFPDSWRIVNNQKTDDLITIAAPAITNKNDFAGCRLRARDDNRFSIYPARFSDEIQRLNYGYAFWESYVGEFKHAEINHFQNNVGLGRGPGSYVDISFEPLDGPKMEKRGLAVAGLYNNRAYIFECSSQAHAFERWVPVFKDILETVDFEKVIYEFPTGRYRNFLNDNPLIIQGERLFVDEYRF